MLSVDIDVCVYGRRLHECAQVITDFVVNIALFIACSKRAHGNKTDLGSIRSHGEAVCKKFMRERADMCAAFLRRRLTLSGFISRANRSPITTRNLVVMGQNELNYQISGSYREQV